MLLGPEEEALLAGERGQAASLAMEVLLELGKCCGAERFIPITQAHIDGCLYPATGEAGLEFAEKLVSLGARVAVPTTLNITGRDTHNWERFRIPADLSGKCGRMEAAYLAMGCIPTWTCAPYQCGPLVPRFGEQIAWAESNAICYANSVLGARTNRYGDLVDICAAIAGRVPETGFHVTENRRGQVLIRLLPDAWAAWRDDAAAAVLGYLVGEAAGERVPVIEGAPPLDGDELKAVCAAAASSGAVGLLHIVGVTPEAVTREMAFGGRGPAEAVDLGPGELEACRERLGGGTCGDADLVVIGCPHASYAELVRIAQELRGRRVAGGTEMWVQTNALVRDLAFRSGVGGILEAAGVRLLLDTCILQFPLSGWGCRTIVTNSGKMAHYAPGMTGARVMLRGLAGCVEAAVTGRAVPDA